MAIPQRRFVLVQHTILLIFVLIALYGYTSSSMYKFNLYYNHHNKRIALSHFLFRDLCITSLGIISMLRSHGSFFSVSFRSLQEHMGTNMNR